MITKRLIFTLVLIAVLRGVASQNSERSQKCTVPDHPENGRYKINGPQNLNPGAVVDVVYLNVTCHLGYKLIGDDVLYCFYGSWSYEKLPSCVRACKVERSLGVEYRCLNLEYLDYISTRDCEDLEVEGTVVQPKCRQPSYYSEIEFSNMLCVDGAWNSTPKCLSECGSVTPKGVPLLVGGDFVERGEVPWHAGIYRKIEVEHEQICGGSIVSETVVLSAAHCFWHETYKQFPAHLFAVAVGQLYRQWNNSHDNRYAQRSNVKDIILSKHFFGAQLSYQHDLAVLIVETPIIYNTYIRPVCLDFRHNFNNEQLQFYNYGKVAGWGLTTGLKGSSSPRLKAVDIPFVSYENCIKMTTPGFAEFLIGDKICAGYGNGTALCKGDSGGGLAFPVRDNGIQRYYLRGVVSTSPVTLDGTMCNLYSLTSFTEVIQHATFIEKYLNQVQCANGQKIPAAKHCDGAVDCADGSDETIKACSTKTCLPFFFRCGYGACADKGAACNGILECSDGSDEAESLCGVKDPLSKQTSTPRIPIRGGICVLPPYPQFGSYYVYGVSDKFPVRPGESFDRFNLTVYCNRGYDVGERRHVTCYNGIWSGDVPKCMGAEAGACDLSENFSVDYWCLTTKSRFEKCITTGMAVGALILPKCKLGYAYASGVPPLMRCTLFGWDSVIICKRICGLTNVSEAIPVTNRSIDLKGGEQPWRTGVYLKTTTPYTHICGGSLVSFNAVLTVASCFWDGVGKQKPASNYAVAFGKLRKQWDHPLDVEIQKRNVTEVKIPIEYRGSSDNYQNNIAILLLEETISLSQYVRPVCLHFEPEFEKTQTTNPYGSQSAVWSLPDDNSNGSQILEIAKINNVDKDKCTSEIQPEYRQLVTEDKYCGKLKDELASHVCKNDIGVGLSYETHHIQVHRYYILRSMIANTGSGTKQCGTKNLFILTRIQPHEKFIMEYLSYKIYTEPKKP